MDKIALIKAEIERLKAENRSIKCKANSAYCEGYDDAFYDLIPFLSTLEEQAKYKVRNPIFDECVANVDPEVREEVRRNIDFEQELYNHFGQIRDFTLGMRIGQYFYNLGRDSVPLPEDTVLFNKGVAEGKRLMMEEVVEGEYDQYPAAIYLPTPIPRMNKGDKVKIIIVKED